MKISARFLTFLAGSALAFGLFGSTSAVAADMKVATVDLDYVFKNYSETKHVETVINRRLMDYRAARREKEEALRKLQAEVVDMRRQIEDAALGTEKKAAITKDLETKSTDGRKLLQELDDFVRGTENELQQLSERRRKEILDKIRKIIEIKAKEQAYNFVFDVSGLSANAVPVILYNDNRNDITQAVLATLNRDAPPPPPPAPQTAPAPEGEKRP